MPTKAQKNRLKHQRRKDAHRKTYSQEQSAIEQVKRRIIKKQLEDARSGYTVALVSVCGQLSAGHLKREREARRQAKQAESKEDTQVWYNTMRRNNKLSAPQQPRKPFKSGQRRRNTLRAKGFRYQYDENNSELGDWIFVRGQAA